MNSADSEYYTTDGHDDDEDYGDYDDGVDDDDGNDGEDQFCYYNDDYTCYTRTVIECT